MQAQKRKPSSGSSPPPHDIRVAVWTVATLAVGVGCHGSHPTRATGVQSETRLSTVVDERTLYVSDVFDDADGVLEVAARCDFDELVVYGLGVPLRADPARVAALVERARHQNVTVVAPVAGLDRVSLLARYEREHPRARFGRWATELEYWNEPARDGAFNRFRALLRAMRAAAPTTPLDAYLGYPTEAEAAWIAAHVDRVYASMAVRTPARVARWGRGLRSHRFRHRLFAGRVEVVPILYARGDAHMGRWLRRHSLAAAERRVERDLPGVSRIAFFDFESLRALGALGAGCHE